MCYWWISRSTGRFSITKIKHFKDCVPLRGLHTPAKGARFPIGLLCYLFRVYLLCFRWDHRRSCCWSTQSESTWCPPAHTPPTNRDVNRDQSQNTKHRTRLEFKKMQTKHRRRAQRNFTCSAFRVSSMNICCSFSFTKLMQNCSNPFFWWRDNMVNKIHTD